MKEEDKIKVYDNIVIEKTKNWERIYKFLLEVNKPVSAYTLMSALNLTRTKFYNALKWLRMMDLVVVELDPNDMRKHLYRVKKSIK